MAEVIDASVAIKWFIIEPGRDAATQVLAKVIRAPRNYCVPEFFYFEMANIFNRLIPQPTSAQIELFSLMLKIGIHRVQMSPAMFQDIREFQLLGLSGYDAAYVSVAKQVKGKWLTFDEKAHKRIQNLGLSTLL